LLLLLFVASIVQFLKIKVGVPVEEVGERKEQAEDVRRKAKMK
jgi:hypothetical protein